MEYLSVNILLSTNHNLNLYLIVGGVVLFILIFMINKVIDGTREKLENEDKKVEFLKTKYKNKIEELEDDEISAEIIVDKPYRIDKPWKVFKVTDRGFQGSSFKSQHKSTHLLDISDSDLEKLMK